MLASLLLVFREVLEAALIVSIVAAATRGVSRRGAWISAGLGLGVIGALLVAAFAGAIADAMSGMGQEWFNAIVLLAAVLMIGWHVVWMSRHARELASQMKSVGTDVSAGSRPMTALLVVAMFRRNRPIEGARSYFRIRPISPWTCWSYFEGGGDDDGTDRVD